VVFITVVLAMVLLILGLLYVVRKLFLKTRHDNAKAGRANCSTSSSRAMRTALAPTSVSSASDAMPEFAYGELSGAVAAASRMGKEKATRPFDYAICLCEFPDHDRLRLLLACGHAFRLRSDAPSSQHATSSPFACLEGGRGTRERGRRGGKSRGSEMASRHRSSKMPGERGEIANRLASGDGCQAC